MRPCSPPGSLLCLILVRFEVQLIIRHRHQFVAHAEKLADAPTALSYSSEQKYEKPTPIVRYRPARSLRGNRCVIERHASGEEKGNVRHSHK